MADSKTQFVLRGFQQVVDSRVFTFERIAADHSRSLVSVWADLLVARQYRIPWQELPLLCRAALERTDQPGDGQVFIVSEADMQLHAQAMAECADAAKRRKMSRRPPPPQLVPRDA